jgi:hypothetical protein
MYLNRKSWPSELNLCDWMMADKIRMSFSPEMRQLGSCFGRLDEKESRYVYLHVVKEVLTR